MPALDPDHGSGLEMGDFLGAPSIHEVVAEHMFFHGCFVKDGLDFADRSPCLP